MTWLVVVLAFVVLGVAVIAAAFGGRRSPSSRPSKASRRAIAIGATVLIVVTGIGLPILGLVSGHDDAADAAPGVKLTASEVTGPPALRGELLELPPARRGQRRRQGGAEPRRAAPEGRAHRGCGAQRARPRCRPDAPGPALRAGRSRTSRPSSRRPPAAEPAPLPEPGAGPRARRSRATSTAARPAGASPAPDRAPGRCYDPASSRPLSLRPPAAAG